MLSTRSLFNVVKRSSTTRTSVVARNSFKNNQRSFFAKAPAVTSSFGWKTIAAGLGIGMMSAWWLSQDENKSVAHAASAEPPSESLAQPTVVTGNLVSTGFLIVHLKANADIQKVAKVAAKIPAIAKTIADGEPIYAGVAFGTQTWEKLSKSKKLGTPANFSHFSEKSGQHGKMPATGGDILVHVKASTRSQAYEVIQTFVNQLPEGSVESIDDEYGWHYQEGRDLSGFIDGTENVADPKERRAAALLPTGGSYVIHQRWIHNLKFLQSKSVKQQEEIVGRTKQDSAELSNLPKTSHVARSRDEKGSRIPIVRQSMPFGGVKGPHGLLFIAYANDPARFDLLLDRMVGKSGGSDNDAIMSFSNCIASQYYYVPSVKELASLA